MTTIHEFNNEGAPFKEVVLYAGDILSDSAGEVYLAVYSYITGVATISVVRIRNGLAIAEGVPYACNGKFCIKLSNLFRSPESYKIWKNVRHTLIG